jgi:hypothetical protein
MMSVFCIDKALMLVFFNVIRFLRRARNPEPRMAHDTVNKTQTLDYVDIGLRNYAIALDHSVDLVLFMISETASGRHGDMEYLFGMLDRAGESLLQANAALQRSIDPNWTQMGGHDD